MSLGDELSRTGVTRTEVTKGRGGSDADVSLIRLLPLSDFRLLNITTLHLL